MAKICPNCGKETDSKFCPDCGTDLSTIPSIETEVISDTSKEISSDVNSGEVDASTPLNKSVKKKSALSMGNSGNKGKKKPIALIVLAVLVVFGLFGCLGGGGSSNNDSSLSDDNEAIETSQVEETPEIEEEPIVEKEPEMTASQRNAYRSAQNYISMMAFSKQGLIDQLSSEYGDNYDKEDAEFAVNYLEENGEVDWVEEAKEAAQNYLDMMPFSKQELIDQLSSDYGDKYTYEQAEKAVEAVYD